MNVDDQQNGQCHRAIVRQSVFEDERGQNDRVVMATVLGHEPGDIRDGEKEDEQVDGTENSAADAGADDASGH